MPLMRCPVPGVATGRKPFPGGMPPPAGCRPARGPSRPSGARPAYLDAGGVAAAVSVETPAAVAACCSFLRSAACFCSRMASSR